MANRFRRLNKLNPFKDRTPVQRRRAAGYLLITLISFAVSVSGTRLFLEITGYPQLGSGGIHIAHVLWGGLFLFVSALLPLILVNEWAFTLSAAIAGFGIGLFIDEVGKFITQNNDYFHPTAAPIVYVFFLFTVLVFVLVRQQRKISYRAKMYGILEQFNEVLDRDLSSDEYDQLMSQLDDVIRKDESKAEIELALSLKSYLESNRGRVVPHDPTVYDMIRNAWIRFEKKWLNRKRFCRILIIGLLAWGVWALISPVGFLLIMRSPDQLQTFVEQLISNRLVRNTSGLNWFEARILLGGGAGIVSIIAAVMLSFKAERTAVWVGIIDLLVTLTIVNPLVFYFEQFSTIVLAVFQFVLFILLIRYRKLFLEEDNAEKKTRA